MRLFHTAVACYPVFYNGYDSRTDKTAITGFGFIPQKSKRRCRQCHVLNRESTAAERVIASQDNSIRVLQPSRYETCVDAYFTFRLPCLASLCTSLLFWMLFYQKEALIPHGTKKKRRRSSKQEDTYDMKVPVGKKTLSDDPPKEHPYHAFPREFRRLRRFRAIFT